MAGYNGGANDPKLKQFVKSIEDEYAHKMDSFAASPEDFQGWALGGMATIRYKMGHLLNTTVPGTGFRKDRGRWEV
jgi:hypothetical protein